MTSQRSVSLAAATTEPLTLAQAKKQLEIAPDDTFHDDHVTDLIRAARESVENDTSEILVSRSMVEKVENWPSCDYYVFKHPVTAIGSITYYDGLNTSQTLATTYYSLDQPRRRVWFNRDLALPSVYDRWDAITITMTAGLAQVPLVLKQAMLMWIGYHFENRDMLKNEAIYTRSAYENLVRQYLRSSYP